VGRYGSLIAKREQILAIAARSGVCSGRDVGGRNSRRNGSGVRLWPHSLGLGGAGASAEAQCRLLLSEDLKVWFTWRGVTVTNPFAATLHPMLAALLMPIEE
jgi:hypothetical protein